MSGRGKQTIYRVLNALLGLLAAVGTGLIVAYSVRGGTVTQAQWACFLVGLALLILLPSDVLVHEFGHILFGLAAGMRPVAVKVGYFSVSRRGIRFAGRSNVDGVSAMRPVGGRHMRVRFALVTLGGAFCNLVYAIVFLTLWLVLPPAPALLFFALFAPLNFYEGIAALLPAELPAGRTDGAIFIGLIGRKPFAEVMLAVLSAQGTLARGSFADLPRSLLFETPVTREDELPFIALTQLRWQYLFLAGDDAGAAEQLRRLEGLIDYLPPDSRAEIACDLSYGYSVIMRDRATAEKYLSEADGAKGSCPYRSAAAAIGGEGKEEALRLAAKEKMRGVSELETAKLERIP